MAVSTKIGALFGGATPTCPACGSARFVEREQFQIGLMWLEKPIPFWECLDCGHEVRD